MEETIEMPLERAAMARIAGVTARHLDRLFAAYLGTSFLDQYRRIRLQHAHRLLKQSPLSVSEIAVATGFSSLSHFSRMFRAVYGIAPRAARRE